MRKFVIVLIILVFSSVNVFPLSAKIQPSFNVDPSVVKWLNSNISPITKLPYSFHVPEQHRPQVFQQMDDAGLINGIIERVITQKGLDIYDGAVYQIVQTMLAGPQNLEQAYLPLKYYWEGSVGDLWNVRAGYPINNYVYDASDPERVSSNVSAHGRRGFVFRIINADGEFLVSDPKNGQTTFSGFPQQDRLHWVDWKPVAGENAWVVIAAMQLYHQKYFDKEKGVYAINPESIELKLAKELTRAALLLQADCGGIRMAPLGTHRNVSGQEAKDFTNNNWWFNHISTENNISWYSALRMLYAVTKDETYKKSMQGIEKYMVFVWDEEQGYFHQGAQQISGWWKRSKEQFALDVQTWAIACFGPQQIDDWLGHGAALKLWNTSKKRSGVFAQDGSIDGVGYTDENDRISVEWTAGAIVALDELDKYYKNDKHGNMDQARRDRLSMRFSMETLRAALPDEQAAYSYSSKRGWIPFGWNSHAPEVMSLASTAWMVFVDAGVNPFKILNS